MVLRWLTRFVSTCMAEVKCSLLPDCSLRAKHTQPMNTRLGNLRPDWQVSEVAPIVNLAIPTGKPLLLPQAGRENGRYWNFKLSGSFATFRRIFSDQTVLADSSSLVLHTMLTHQAHKWMSTGADAARYLLPLLLLFTSSCYIDPPCKPPILSLTGFKRSEAAHVCCSL
jgi:hypothetical protein